MILDMFPAAVGGKSAGDGGHVISRWSRLGWLTHIGTELHKTYGPMFRPTTPDEYKKISKETLANKYKNIDKMLEGKQ